MLTDRQFEIVEAMGITVREFTEDALRERYNVAKAMGFTNKTFTGWLEDRFKLWQKENGEPRKATSKVTALMQKAIALAGSEARLGAAAGVSQHAIWHAKSKGRVTAELATAIDRATDGQVSKAMLRPDLFA